MRIFSHLMAILAMLILVGTGCAGPPRAQDGLPQVAGMNDSKASTPTPETVPGPGLCPDRPIPIGVVLNPTENGTILGTLGYELFRGSLIGTLQKKCKSQ